MILTIWWQSFRLISSTINGSMYWLPIMVCPKIICEHHKLSRENVLKKTKSNETLFIPHNNNHEFDNQIIMTKRNTKYYYKIDPLVFHGSIELQNLKFVFLFENFSWFGRFTYITNKTASIKWMKNFIIKLFLF